MMSRQSSQAPFSPPLSRSPHNHTHTHTHTHTQSPPPTHTQTHTHTHTHNSSPMFAHRRGYLYKLLGSTAAHDELLLNREMVRMTHLPPNVSLSIQSHTTNQM